MFSAEDIAWLKPFAYSLLASVGGTIGYIMRAIDGKQKPTILRGIAEGASAGFVGFLMLLLCQATGLSEAWTGVVVGVSGWLGSNVTIQILERAVRKKLGVDQRSTPESTDVDNPEQQ